MHSSTCSTWSLFCHCTCTPSFIPFPYIIKIFIFLLSTIYYITNVRYCYRCLCDICWDYKFTAVLWLFSEDFILLLSWQGWVKFMDYELCYRNVFVVCRMCRMCRWVIWGCFTIFTFWLLSITIFTYWLYSIIVIVYVIVCLCKILSLYFNLIISLSISIFPLILHLSSSYLIPLHFNPIQFHL